MLSLSGNDITLTRGDSLSITIDIADSLGTPVTFETGDILYFTVKKSYSTREKSIQKKIISPSSSTIEIDISIVEKIRKMYSMNEVRDFYNSYAIFR